MQPLGRRYAKPLLLALLTFAVTLPKMVQAAAIPTVTALTISSSSVASPAAVTLTASVTAGGAPLTTGSIIFCDASAALCEDAAIVGRAQLTASGTATLKITPAIGTHSYKAIFTHTAAAAASTSGAQTVTVTGLYPTTTAIAASGNPSAYLLTATVVGFASQPPILAGSVSFQDTTNGNAVLGTSPLGTPVVAQSFTGAPGSPVPTGNTPASAGVGDFNEDGKPDLAVMNSGDNQVSILLGKGDGTFAAGAKAGPVGTTPCIIPNGISNCSIAVGDFNHDGHADLALTSGGDNTVTILLGNGGGAFTQAAGSPILAGDFPEAVRIGDFNNDGLLDLAVANAKDGTVSVLLGNGDGTFTAASPLVSVGAFPFFLAIADFNGDGNADLAVVNGISFTVSIMLGNGDGTFTEASGSPIPVGTGSCPVVAADFNGDGIVDLAVANYTDNTVDVLLGNGDGTFTATAGSPITVGLNPFAMVALDFNSDGHTDLAVTNYSGNSLTLLIGDGKGGFAPAGADFALGDLPNDVVTADFNGDGKPDLAIPESGDTNTTILLNFVTQTATASLANVSFPGAATHYVDASYPGNASFDPSTSTTVALLGAGVPTTLTLSASPPQQLVTMPVTFTAQLAFAAEEFPTGTPSGTVSFFDAGALLGTAPINAAGQAVYTTSSLTAGVHTITASYGGGSNFLPSTTSTALSITISDLQIARTGNNDTTVLPGTTVTYTLNVAPLVATTFLYTVSFSTAGLPAGAISSFSPVTLAAGGGATKVTLTIQTAGTAALNAPPPTSPYGNLPLALGLLLPLLGVAPIRRRMRQMPGMLAVLLLAALSLGAVAGLSGCSKPGLFAARKVPYSITVTATSGTLQRSTSVPLAIQ